jgi:predicted nuclease with TOPRIM domain
MQLRSEIQIVTMIRAMKDVVIPAIDPANGPAIEQSQLVLGMLSLLREQLPVEFRFDRDELERLTIAAGNLARLCEVDTELRERVRALAALEATARDRLERCAVDPSEVRDCSRRLREAIARLVSEADAAATPERWTMIERQVLDLSRELLVRERAFVAPQGWETGSDFPKIEELLDVRRATSGPKSER